MKAYYTLRTISLSLLLLFFTTNVSAQEKTGSIKGYCYADKKNTPVIKASIRITSTETNKSFNVLSDSTGNYFIENLKPGEYSIKAQAPYHTVFRRSGIKIQSGKTTERDVRFTPIEVLTVEETEAAEDNVSRSEKESRKVRNSGYKKYKTNGISNAYSSGSGGYTGGNTGDYNPNHNTESYASVEENGFKASRTTPLSTFSVDVDAASYSNCRRFILSGNKPDKGAVRVEEMINYFNYDYEDPKDEHPFSITTEVGDCPWSENKLVHIGLQGERIEKKDIPSSNLVFLLDVSGSMNNANKLPLLKKSFRLLVDELCEKDVVSIVVYAGAAGCVLEPTAGNESPKILKSLEDLRAGGSTAGGAGIELAYKIAQENYIDGGNNRVILATDGDFNIGMSSDAAMQGLIEEKRKTGIFLTCLGFGTGNYKDSKMEILADKGNGNYAYIDNVMEAKKVMVTEMGATLNTIAKDVKIQVEFNPEVISSYRLVGYENRLLADEDFNDDTKDAGEIGAGHSVTALYEVVLKGEEDSSTATAVDPLKYQTNVSTDAANGDEMLTVKFRYKDPEGSKSKLIERQLKNKITAENKLSQNFNFSAAVAEFGMLLSDSEYKGTATFDQCMELAAKNMGKDANGYRAEFLKIVDAAKIVYGK